MSDQHLLISDYQIEKGIESIIAQALDCARIHPQFRAVTLESYRQQIIGTKTLLSYAQGGMAMRWRALISNAIDFMDREILKAQGESRSGQVHVSDGFFGHAAPSSPVASSVAGGRA